MEEMTTKELTAYLQCAVELESSVYRQEAAIQQANEDLQFPYPSKKYIAKPSNQADHLTKPSAPTLETKNKFFNIVFIGLGVYMIIMAVFLIFLKLDDLGDLESIEIGIMILSLLMGYICCAWPIRRNRRIDETNSRRTQEYKRAVDKYEKAVIAANQKYQKDLALYNKESEEAQKNYNKAYAIAEQNFALAKEAVSQLDLPYEETREALQKLYSKDVIFPKYRNMVAVCTMYEYFVTGRCTELSGPNGAYNLYEAELRQNLIINHLDTILDNLENIKQNQYTLYQEMYTTNNILSGISSDIEDILGGTREIANAANISAHCSQSIAKNTEALKYITLING